MNTDTLPSQAKTWIQIAAISAMVLGLIQFGVFVWSIWNIAADGVLDQLPLILLSSNAFYIAGALLLVGGFLLWMGRPWAWILIVGAVGFRLVMVLWLWVQRGELRLFRLEGFFDILYLFSILLSIFALVLLLLPDTRRYLRIQIEYVGFAVALLCLLVMDNIAMQFLNHYLF